ncbi:hypothetical protein H5J22_02640 [Cetobacterium sp. 8H]|uniref:hypothetical protein n=1 Tax=Cetobacterium sp. 8H TaxID=2759681 RepID=UPI00163C9805|nr:hypothetical protein [Cetobacterium sp. 8H]MBC2850341.1 hypothetical protein [Cetobacterium sp. 8H]
MPVEDFVKYITQAKGKYLREENKEVIDIIFDSEDEKSITFLVTGVGTKEPKKITIEKVVN